MKNDVNGIKNKYIDFVTNRMENDMYDVQSYSEKELFDILDLFHPTDRELEAKILSYIDKYSDNSNQDTLRLYSFFLDIYKRFFIIENEEEDDDEVLLLEGFEGGIPNIDTKDTKKEEKSNIQLTTTLPYTRGNLNPILKQTIQRTITIDSKYRDTQSRISTDFTFNFTETLRDVVSIKLYAVQIPYTWYTISKSYGSNFIFIKGNSPGINNGNHDISINIIPGNYTLTTVGADNITSITGTIQTAFANLPNLYTDISFGNTNLLYNVNTCKATFNIDIQKYYNESYYRFEFPGPFYSPYPPTNINRKSYLSSFLGFNHSSYSTSSVYTVSSPTPLNISQTNYKFDSSNNTIRIIQYYTDSTNGYIPNVSTIYQDIAITFPISTTFQSQSSIYNIVNTQIQNDPRLNRPGYIDSSVNFLQIQGKDKVGNNIQDNGSYYFEWKLKLNRYNGNNIPQSKTVLILPTNETDTNNPIWVGNKSCFFFNSVYNEINNLFSETYVSSSNYIITDNVYYYLSCNENNYNKRKVNDFSYNLTPSLSYSLNEYLSEINKGFVEINNKKKSSNYDSNIFNTTDTIVTSPSSVSAAYLNDVDSRFHMSLDINKYFKTENFRIDLSGSFLKNILQFNNVSNVPLYPDISFAAISITQTTYGSNVYPLIMVVYPDLSNSLINGISNDVSYNVYLPLNTSFYGIYGLESAINNAFRIYSDVSNSYPLSNCSISIKSDPTSGVNKIKSILTIDITKVLTQNDYTVSFHDLSYNTDASYNQTSWYQYLKLYQSSYKLSNYSYNSYSDISGNDIINSDQVDLTIGGNYNVFQLIPIDDGVIGAGPISFRIPPLKYNRIELFKAMNLLFDNNPITAGTRVSYISQNGFEYTKIRWNVNKIYTSQDYKIVFYDLYSFVSCFVGNSSIRNATQDTTLGYILGFQGLTEYPLSINNFNNGYYFDTVNNANTDSLYTITNSKDGYRSVVSLTGDKLVSIYLYNNFMIILDDYNLNHLNDGLITPATKDNNLSLPNYASRAKYICDPITKQVLNTGITNVASNNLTQNQIYSINQIINTQNTPKGYTNPGVYASNIFGLIPIKTTGYTPGQIYVEFGGTLQAQDRIYFGPVNIYRMAISLLNDRGEIVDLNGANWSLQLICEQLYQNNNDVKS